MSTPTEELPSVTSCTFDMSLVVSTTRPMRPLRSEEHTSELQSQSNLVCRLLLEKKKKLHVARLERQAHPSRRRTSYSHIATRAHHAAVLIEPEVHHHVFHYERHEHVPAPTQPAP